MALQGSKLAGGNPKSPRVENDFYATNPKAVEMLMDVYKFNNGNFLEPCVGNGNIAKVIEKRYPKSKIVGIDIIDRGYKNTLKTDFLTCNLNEKFDNIVTNPPFSLSQEFIEKSISLLNENGKIAMFLKVQFLESDKRVNFFKKYPPKYIYVFSKRMATWNNGNEFDKNGETWKTTMCHCWFVWEEGFAGDPIVRWLY